MSHEPHEPHEKMLHADEVFLVQGAIFEVHRVMGFGFLEAVYQECLGLEFAARNIPFLALRPVTLTYKGTPLRATYQPDFICFERIILELKSTRDIGPSIGRRS